MPQFGDTRNTEHYQSALNFQRRVKYCKAVTQEGVYCVTTLLSVVLKLCSNSHVQICDSVNSTLTQTSRKSIQAIYRNFSRGNANVMVTLLPIQKQQDVYNCGLFAVTFVITILEGKFFVFVFIIANTSTN